MKGESGVAGIKDNLASAEATIKDIDSGPGLQTGRPRACRAGLVCCCQPVVDALNALEATQGQERKTRTTKMAKPRRSSARQKKW